MIKKNGHGHGGGHLKPQPLRESQQEQKSLQSQQMNTSFSFNPNQQIMNHNMKCLNFLQWLQVVKFFIGRKRKMHSLNGSYHHQEEIEASFQEVGCKKF